MLSELNLSDIIERYTVQKESLAKLAKEYKVEYSLLRSLVELKGIHIRTRTEALQKYVKYSTCVICGRQFRMRERWDSSTNHHNKTCGDPNCLHILRSRSSKWTDERKEKISQLFTGREVTWTVRRREQSANWKGGKSPSVYREIAFEEEGLEKRCSVCGSTTDLCVHHIDGNRSNNTPENHLILCKKHHTSNHDKQGDSGWAVHNKRVVLGISVEELTKELNAGKSLRAICREYSVSFKPLARLMAKYNLEIPKKIAGKEIGRLCDTSHWTRYQLPAGDFFLSSSFLKVS